MEEQDVFNNRIDLRELQATVEQLKINIGNALVGQDNMVELMIAAILADGHILIEGVPGIAKTLSAKLLAKMISVDFNRIQFTPDLMPSDVTGSTMFNAKESNFEFNKGAIFTNIVLIDEINRAPAKTQSALFEVMEERQVTVDGQTYILDKPFLAFATQNPLEHEGTYRLPEAQLDRFLFKIDVTYPSAEEEYQILLNEHNRPEDKNIDNVKPVLSKEELLKFQAQVKKIQVEENLMKYISEIINSTRNHPALYLGASPRASINTLIASKAYAAMNGRDFVIPEDIQIVVVPILSHRIYLTPEKELEGSNETQIINDIIKAVEVPR